MILFVADSFLPSSAVLLGPGPSSTIVTIPGMGVTLRSFASKFSKGSPLANIEAVTGAGHPHETEPELRKRLPSEKGHSPMSWQAETQIGFLSDS
jgi:hypothetical protein